MGYFPLQCFSWGNLTKTFFKLPSVWANFLDKKKSFLSFWLMQCLVLKLHFNSNEKHIQNRLLNEQLETGICLCHHKIIYIDLYVLHIMNWLTTANINISGCMQPCAEPCIYTTASKLNFFEESTSVRESHWKP